MIKFLLTSDSLQNHCKLVNNNEVIEFIKIRKYKSLKLTNFNLPEQISIFKNCKSIIAPFRTSGLPTWLFVKKRLKLLVIPSDNKSLLYKKNCEINKLKYKSIYLKKYIITKMAI